MFKRKNKEVVVTQEAAPIVRYEKTVEATVRLTIILPDMNDEPVKAEELEDLISRYLCADDVRVTSIKTFVRDK